MGCRKLRSWGFVASIIAFSFLFGAFVSLGQPPSAPHQGHHDLELPHMRQLRKITLTPKAPGHNPADGQPPPDFGEPAKKGGEMGQPNVPAHANRRLGACFTV